MTGASARTVAASRKRRGETHAAIARRDETAGDTASAEREVQGDGENHDRDTCRGPAEQSRTVRGREPEGERDAHRAEDAERVPVADRFGEPVDGDRVVGAEMLREQPRGQAVCGHAL